MTTSKTFNSEAAARAAFSKLQHAGISNEQETSVQIKYARFTLNADTITAASTYYERDTLQNAIVSPETL